MGALGFFGVGVAVADPELKYVGQSNTAVCTVNLAFNRSFQDRDKKWQKETCYMRAQVWGARAEKMSEIVSKGQPVYVTGYIKQETWEKDDVKRTNYKLSISDFHPCERFTNGKSTGGATNQEQQSPTDIPQTVPNDDIPF